MKDSGNVPNEGMSWSIWLKWQNLPAHGSKKKIDRWAGYCHFVWWSWAHALSLSLSPSLHFPQKFTTNLATFSHLSCFSFCWCYFALIFASVYVCVCVIFIHLNSFSLFFVDDVVCYSFCFCSCWSIERFYLVGWSISFALTVCVARCGLTHGL